MGQCCRYHCLIPKKVMDKYMDMDDEKHRFLEEQVRKAQASGEVDLDDLNYVSEKGAKNWND